MATQYTVPLKRDMSRDYTGFSPDFWPTIAGLFIAALFAAFVLLLIANDIYACQQWHAFYAEQQIRIASQHPTK